MPGGFVLPYEPLDTAVQRELREEPGIQTRFLEQLYTFGRVDRYEAFQRKGFVFEIW